MSAQMVNSVFDCPDKISQKIKKWESFSNTLFQNDALCLKLNCARISKSRRAPKPISLCLGDHTLYYFKKEVPIGMLPLNFVTIGTKSYDGQQIICLSRNQKIVDFMVDDPESFLQLLSSRCILTTFHEDYHVEKKIGIGNQATVFQAIKKKTNQRFAVKAFSKSCQTFVKDRLQSEIGAMRNLSHPNLLHLYEVHETQNTIYLVIDLLAGGDLFQRIQKTIYSDDKLQQLMYKLCQALQYMHSRGFMHRDIKPQNILLRSKESDVDIVLADFGLAMSIHERPIFKRCGTPGFIAPEVLHYEKNQNFYDEKCDIFSAGAIFYKLITGNNPFKGVDQSKTLEFNQKCLINFDVKQICKAPKPVKSLLKKMLRVNPQARYSAEKCLSHEYFKDMYQGEDQQFIKQESSLVQIVQQLFENDENDNFELITQDQQWNGNVDTIGSSPKLSPQIPPEKMKGSLSKFGQFCVAMEAFNQGQSPKKKNDDSLYKMALKNAYQVRTRDDNDVEEIVQKQKSLPKSQFLKKSNSLNI